jgi:hypothetical protein
VLFSNYKCVVLELEMWLLWNNKCVCLFSLCNFFVFLCSMQGQRGPLSDEIIDMALKPLKDQLLRVEQEGRDVKNVVSSKIGNASSSSSRCD